MRNDEIFRTTLSNIPVSVNAQLGDPFQRTQWINTREKLQELEMANHDGAVALITKSILTWEQLDFIQRSKLDLFLFLSITGLNENKSVTFKEIMENYFKVCDTRKNVVVFIRPIIPGYNDKVSIIKPIIEMAAERNKIVIIRGYKDIVKLTKNAFLDTKFLSTLKDICIKTDVQVYDKTASYVSSIRKNHFLNYGDAQMDTGVKLLQRLGYPLGIKDKAIILDSNYRYTQGDLNFIRMVTGKVVSKKLDEKDAIMTIKKNGIMLDCSSSWFGWARRIPCDINCWYCISKVQGLNEHKEMDLGCRPIDLL